MRFRFNSRLDMREARFSSRVLRNYAAVALPEMLAIRAAAEDVTEILLYDEIGYWGVTAKEFALALAQCGPGPVHVRINSPGGDSFDGLAIYNQLRARSTPVTVTVDGLAASAASIIAMAGTALHMPEQAMLMIHNCWGVCVGNRNDMTDFAAVMGKNDGLMAEIYAKKSGKSVADMAAAMDAETWYTSSEAKAAGLCDLILSDAPPNALADARPIAALLPRALRAAAAMRSALPDYDPDGDGDNDAQEALTLVDAAIGLLGNARDALAGVDDDAEEGAAAAETGMPIVPGAEADPQLAAAGAAAADSEELPNGSDDNTERAIAIARARQRQAEAELV